MRWSLNAARLSLSDSRLQVNYHSPKRVITMSYHKGLFSSQRVIADTMVFETFSIGRGIVLGIGIYDMTTVL